MKTGAAHTPDRHSMLSEESSERHIDFEACDQQFGQTPDNKPALVRSVQKIGKSVRNLAERLHGAGGHQRHLQKTESYHAIPALLSSEALSDTEVRLDERIRTLCLVVIALSGLVGGIYFGRGVMLPFVLALAFSYLLTPLIDLLSCRDAKCRVKLPRALAIIIAVLVAVGMIGVLVLVLYSSVPQPNFEVALIFTQPMCNSSQRPSCTMCSTGANFCQACPDICRKGGSFAQ